MKNSRAVRETLEPLEAGRGNFCKKRPKRSKARHEGFHLAARKRYCEPNDGVARRLHCGNIRFLLLMCKEICVVNFVRHGKIFRENMSQIYFHPGVKLRRRWSPNVEQAHKSNHMGFSGINRQVFNVFTGKDFEFFHQCVNVAAGESAD